MDIDNETKKLLIKEKKADGPAWMKKLDKIKESKNEDKSIDYDEEKKSNRGSNRSKSSDDSLNKRSNFDIESPSKGGGKNLNIKFSSNSEDTDVFNKSPKNNSDGRKIEIESVDSVGRLSGGNKRGSKHKLN